MGCVEKLSFCFLNSFSGGREVRKGHFRLGQNAPRTSTKSIIYRVAHKKRSQICTDVVLLNNRIQTKINNIFKSNHS